MDDPWTTHGGPPQPRGLPIGDPPATHGILMGYPWTTRGWPMGGPWATHVLRGEAWAVHLPRLYLHGLPWDTRR